MGPSVIRVALADDQPLVRAGFRMLLDGEDDIEVVGEADDGVAALALVRAERPDVVLLDVRMPNLDGLEALRAIGDDPDLAAVKVLVLPPAKRRAPGGSPESSGCWPGGAFEVDG